MILQWLRPSSQKLYKYSYVKRYMSIRPRIPSPNVKQKASLFNIEILSYGIGSVICSAFAYWQWELQKKSEEEIKKLRSSFYEKPLEFPDNLDELHNLIQKPVTITGEFDHSKEMFIGLRTMVVSGTGEYLGESYSTDKTKMGYIVITPFKLKDRDLVILVNRGWIHSSLKDPSLRSEGQIEGVVTLTAVIQEYITDERIPKATNQTIYYLRNTLKLAVNVGCSPIYAEALDGVYGGPLAGQVEVHGIKDHTSAYACSGVTSLVIACFAGVKLLLRFKGR